MVYSYKIIKLADDFEQKYTHTDKIIKLLKDGIEDSQLDYLRSGMRSMKPFFDAYEEGINMGLSSNQIASGIPYNKSGNKFPPISIEVESNGKMYLTDGRHRYKAAREYGANIILAKVKQYDNNGNIIFETIKNIKLI